jgi:arylsulfatase A-like enzyme
MTGREPYHVLQGTNYVSGGMNMIPAKLKQVGYVTHQVGKWHLGALMQWMAPAGRGFDSSFGYLSGGEDHYTHAVGAAIFGCSGTDLYKTDAPAYTGNCTYGAYLYNNEVISIIEKHNTSQPPFLYVATQEPHGPDQVPSIYSDIFNSTFPPPMPFTMAW